MNALELHNISYRIGDAQILTNANLRVACGEFVALIGPNGAGKSTLLSAATGDLPGSDGDVLLFGDSIKNLSPTIQSRRRAMQVQDHSVSYAYYVREVVAMGRWPWRGTPYAAQDDEAIRQGLEFSEMTRFAKREITTLSGGERARAAFSRLCAQQTRLVLADEPTAALDIAHQEIVLKRLRTLADQGAAVVVVIHDLNLASAFADRVVLLSNGMVVADGVPDEVLHAEQLTAVYQTPIEVVRHPRTGHPLVLPLRDDVVLPTHAPNQLVLSSEETTHVY